MINIKEKIITNLKYEFKKKYNININPTKIQCIIIALLSENNEIPESLIDDNVFKKELFDFILELYQNNMLDFTINEK